MSALLAQGAAAVAVVAGLVYARGRLRSRLGAGAASLEVLERRALGRDSGVAVISWCGRELLVGYGASGTTPLHPLAPSDALGSPERP